METSHICWTNRGVSEGLDLWANPQSCGRSINNDFMILMIVLHHPTHHVKRCMAVGQDPYRTPVNILKAFKIDYLGTLGFDPQPYKLIFQCDQ